MYCKHCGATRPNAQIMEGIRNGSRRRLCCTVPDLEAPPIQAENWNAEYQAKVDSDLIRAAWKTPISTTRDQRSLEDLPLFKTGREEQGGLF